MKVFPGFKQEYRKLLTYREGLPTDYRKQNDSGFIVAICLIISGIILAIAVALLPSKAEASVDYKCQSDCLNQGYSYGYCQSICSYDNAPEIKAPRLPQSDYACIKRCTANGRYYHECQQACSY